LLSAGASTASAQDSSTQKDGNNIDSVALLDKKVTKLDKIVSKLPQVSGFVQAMYSWQEGGDDGANYFRIRRARLIFKGNIYKSLMDYNFTTDFAGSVKIVDAYMRITPWKQFSVQIGAFRPSFTIENTFYGSLSMEGIDYPQVVKKMTHLGDITGLSSAGRDLGVQIYGGFFNKRGFSTLEYRLGVFNGNGVMVTKDDNKSKDIAAMLRVNPIKNLAFVGSCYIGEWNNGVSKYNQRWRWSVGFRYDDGKVFARGEYIRGFTEGIKSGSVYKNFKSEGAYVQIGGRFFKEKFAPFVRAEYYAKNLYDQKGTGEPYYTIGIDYNPMKYIRLQLNYTCKTYNNHAVNPAHYPHNVVEVMLTGKF
jgi:hypothetical protein